MTRIRVAMRRMWAVRWLAIVAATLCALVSGGAQSSSGPAIRLRGRMIDSTGRAIAGVRLQLAGSARGTESDSLGLFAIDSLAAGSVAVSFVHPMFVAVTLELPLAVGDTAVVPVMMVAPDAPADVRLEPGMLFGVVTDQQGHALSGADVLVATSGQVARSDTNGRFVLRDLTPVKHLIRVRKLGYYVQYLNVTSSSERALRASIAMESMGTTLGEIVVRADRIYPRLKAFHARAVQNGFGQFATREQITERGWVSVNDMLSHMRGVTMGVDAMNRAIPLGRGNCRMRVLLDGQPLELEAVALSALVNLKDLAGVEVYVGIGSAPIEFAFGRLDSLECGVVGFWTR